jgi:hypothetical protein
MLGGEEIRPIFGILRSSPRRLLARVRRTQLFHPNSGQLFAFEQTVVVGKSWAGPRRSVGEELSITSDVSDVALQRLQSGNFIQREGRTSKGFIDLLALLVYTERCYDVPVCRCYHARQRWDICRTCAHASGLSHPGEISSGTSQTFARSHPALS